MDVADAEKAGIDRVRPGLTSTTGTADHMSVAPVAATRRPTVTIMLITYNHEKYIAQAIDSILMQETEYDFQIHVIEDCSTDRTQEIVTQYVARYPDVVKPFFNAVNIGHKVTQRNTYRGFKTLTGDYFAILEGDDYWTDPHRLQKQVSFLEANPDFAICAGNTVKVYEGATGEPHRFLYWGRQADAELEDVINLSPFFHNAGVLFRNVYKGDPPRHFRNKRSCDIFITIAHAQFGKVHHMDEDFAVYRAHPGGRFSNRPKIDEWMFDINGLRHFNAWLGYRHAKAFSRSIVKYCNYVLSEGRHQESGVPSWHQFANVQRIRASYGLIYYTLDMPRQLTMLVNWLGFHCFSFLYSTLKGLRRTLSRDFMLAVWRSAKAPLARGTRETQIPRSLSATKWEYVSGLDVREIEGAGPVRGQPVLKLTTNGSGGSHSLGGEWEGLTAGAAYRFALWVKALGNTEVQVHLRDSHSNDAETPAEVAGVWVSLSPRSVRAYKGDTPNHGVERKGDGWLRVWTDCRPRGSAIKIYVEMAGKRGKDGSFGVPPEQLLFGGVEMAPSTSGLPERVRSGFAGESPSFADTPWHGGSRPLLLTRATKLDELPNLPDLGDWHFIWDLAVKVVPAQHLFRAQPIVDLLATPTKGRHAVCLCLSGLVPQLAYRVSLWVKPLVGKTDVHVQLRDSTIGSTGKPTHECDVWYNLSTGSVRKVAYGGMVVSGINPEPNGWLRLWADITTSDGWLYICLGLVEAKMATNIFVGTGERLLLGGIVVGELSKQDTEFDVHAAEQTL